ncbi:uncharacterized protein F5Z01DRAFT_657288 [Emericellopsis atlantica]|uniref:Uncharacterized protein n=1 Tax=Emericellopsis atlantica TaxID=2614577 RepID=A0A9P7ZKP9_9HYPO|nr:uncharacterized protein F5Z01DRAFT_657288 [Emericellopsis atlantica]KAG9253472.1 hypothetical protein F5Z01DRAFT_657288 [Emericellopsis atlantica]
MEGAKEGAKARPASSSSPGIKNLAINGSHDRKPLFSRHQSTTSADHAHSPSKQPALSRRASSASTSKLPTSSLSQGTRKPLSLTEAMRLAEKEEGLQADHTDDSQPIDASPSPAPRPWREKKDSVEPIPLKKDGVKRTESIKKDGSEGANWREKSDWRSKKTENHESTNGDAKLPDLVPGIEDLPLPSVEKDPASNLRKTVGPPKSFAPKAQSPDKVFTWQIDDDFTAGDIQVSDSPRLKATANRPFADRLKFDENSEVDIHSKTRVNNPGSQNTRLDEIRSREVKAGNNIPLERPADQQNTKLDDIKAREADAEAKIPIPTRHLSSLPTNTKLDDIRQRETAGLSKRQLASARLEEIREKNAASRSKSPEEIQPVVKGHRPSPSLTQKPIWYRPGGGAVAAVPDTPPSTYKTRRERMAEERAASAASGESPNTSPSDKAAEEPQPTSPRPTLSHRRADSKDLLRQVIRGSSESPASDSQAAKKVGRKSDKTSGEGSPARGSPRRAATTTSAAARRRATTKNGARPSTGIAGLRRIMSSESSSGSKRSSVHSETDPTDRIEGEMSLFAPRDDYSERGSVRAASPFSEPKRSEDVDSTPKPVKHQDVLSMPTPKVSGAYVETPATIRKLDFGAKLDEQDDAKSTSSEPLRARDSDTASDLGGDEKRRRSRSTSSSRPPRARSLPRNKRSLKNTAVLPSVKADLAEIKSMFNLEDSTLDDFEEVLAGTKTASPEIKDLLAKLPEKAPVNDSFDVELDAMKDHDGKIKRRMSDPSPQKPDRISKTVVKQEEDDNTLTLTERMVGKLGRSLAGVRTSQQGIGRLADGFSKTSANRPSAAVKGTTEPVTEKVYIHVKDKDAAGYLHIPIPRLYTTQPGLRLTPLGILTIVFGLWYLFESIMCGLYCQPTSCSSATPCKWSHDDPTFGQAIPVKLDQWATGGAGRSALNAAGRDLADAILDITDSLQGTDIRDVDVQSLTFEGRRRHRRRMMKKGYLKRDEDVDWETRRKWDAWHRARMEKESRAATGEAEVKSVGEDMRIF